MEYDYFPSCYQAVPKDYYEAADIDGEEHGKSLFILLYL